MKPVTVQLVLKMIKHTFRNMAYSKVIVTILLHHTISIILMALIYRLLSIPPDVHYFVLCYLGFHFNSILQ